MNHFDFGRYYKLLFSGREFNDKYNCETTEAENNKSKGINSRKLLEITRWGPNIFLLLLKSSNTFDGKDEN